MQPIARRLPRLPRLLRASWPLALAALVACGGGTPEPKDSDDVAHAEAKPAKPIEPAPTAETSSESPPAKPSAPSPSLGAASMAPPSEANAAPGGDDPWMASHQMAPKDVLAAVRPVQGKAQACFRAGLKRDPSTEGEVKIRFVIANDGVVRVWRDDGSSMSDEDVTTCIGELIKTLKFPKQKSPGDAWGVYTANFSN
jgi:hypothetical protein